MLTLSAIAEISLQDREMLLLVSLLASIGARRPQKVSPYRAQTTASAGNVQ